MGERKQNTMEKKLSNTKVINSYQSFSDDDRAAILQLFNIGCSSREICSEMGWKRSRKSSVNMFLKPYRDGSLQVDSSGVSQSDCVALPVKERKSLNGMSLREGVSKEVDSKYDDEQVEILTRQALSNIKKKQTILVIADTQCKSEESLEYLKWIGKYVADKKPDVVIHIGDHFDLPSLSSYDKGKSSSEGRRLHKDIEAGNLGFEYLNRFINADVGYNPRKIFCLGNHEHRLDRYVDDNPELLGTLGTDKLHFSKYGWEVHPFLKPVEVCGIFFVHYLANPFTGKPYGGNAQSILKTVGRSFVVGHKQLLDIAIRPTIDGKQQIGIINGACYDHMEGYKGYQGNNHFRGITILHEAEDGMAVPMFVSLDYMKEKYYAQDFIAFPEEK